MPLSEPDIFPAYMMSPKLKRMFETLQTIKAQAARVVTRVFVFQPDVKSPKDVTFTFKLCNDHEMAFLFVQPSCWITERDCGAVIIHSLNKMIIMLLWKEH